MLCDICVSDVICMSWVNTEKGDDILDYVVTSRYATSWSRLICREGDLLRRRVTVGLEWNTKDEAMGVGRPYKLCTYRYLWRFEIVDFYPPLSQSVTNLESLKRMLHFWKSEQDMHISPGKLFYVNSNKK